jgi:prepilin-type processing-associated H-X9-DG protein
MNWGSGVQKYGYNGFFRPCLPDPILPTGFVRFADVRDGTSNTALFAEMLAADGQQSRLRSVWNLPTSLLLPSDYDTFATTCSELLVASGANSFVRGRPWAYGDIMYTAYTHILGPNQPNCLNGNLVQPGSYSSGSEHSGGANVVFGDGHTTFISTHVSLSVWRAFGSRSGSD